MIDANLIDKANIPNLISALRECGERAFCNDCPIFDTCDGDIDRAMHDAAAAIEALQAKLPKRGKWIHGKELSRAYIGNCCVGIVYEDFRCSACGVVFKECEKPKWKYCPNCGVKMEAQE